MCQLFLLAAYVHVRVDGRVVNFGRGVCCTCEGCFANAESEIARLACDGCAGILHACGDVSLRGGVPNNAFAVRSAADMARHAATLLACLGEESAGYRATTSDALQLPVAHLLQEPFAAWPRVRSFPHSDTREATPPLQQL